MRFTTTRTSDHRRILIGLALVTVFELPLVHWALVAWLAAGWPWHVMVAALHASTLVWLWRDARALERSAHTLDADALHLELGRRFRGTVPRAAVASASCESLELDTPLTDPPKGTVRITPLETPNVRIILTTPVTLRGPLGVRVTARELWLYVDEPEELVSALGERPRG